jgi:hypothetical protein
MKKALRGGLLALLLATPAHADIAPPTCDQFKAGYDALSSKPLYADFESFAFAASVLADNTLIYSDDTKTSYATREQLIRYLLRLQPIDALIWLQSRYTDVELQLKRCSGSAFEQKRLVLMAPEYKPKPDAKTCGGPMPDLSKPLTK